jgi:proline iminopeptidase
VEKLRQHLGLGKVQVFGGSWGSTLGLAYAEAYPQNVRSLVLRGVFTCTKAEDDFFYHGGAAHFFPDAYETLQAVLPHPERQDYPQQLVKLLQDENPEIRRKAALAWARYEIKIASLECSDEQVESYFKEWDPYDFSLIENYYMAQGCFLEEGQLLRDAGKLAEIPTVIVQGRYDVICPPITAWKLHKAVPKSKLVLVEAAGHSAGEPGIRSALIEAARSLE